MVWQWFEMSADRWHDLKAGFVLDLEAPRCREID